MYCNLIAHIGYVWNVIEHHYAYSSLHLGLLSFSLSTKHLALLCCSSSYVEACWTGMCAANLVMAAQRYFFNSGRNARIPYFTCTYHKDKRSYWTDQDILPFATILLFLMRHLGS